MATTNFVKICSRMRTHESKTRMRSFYRVRPRLRLQLVYSHFCKDLHEKFLGGQLVSCELKSKKF